MRFFRKKEKVCTCNCVEIGKRLDQFQNDLNALDKILKDQDIALAKEMDLTKREIGTVVNNIRNDVSRRLLEFEKETTSKVADRYFKSLEDIFRWNREFSFLEKHLNGDSKNLGSLRRAMIQPLLEMKYKMDDEETSAKVDTVIKSRGEALIHRRRELHDLKIKQERDGKDVKVLVAQIKELDLILGGAK